MNRIVFVAILLASLALAHHGYAGKTRVSPFTVNLLGEQAGSLSLIGIQSASASTAQISQNRRSFSSQIHHTAGEETQLRYDHRAL